MDVGQILALYEFFQDFIRDRTMHYVAGNLILPLTKSAQLSYAEVAGTQRVQWFVSHFWGTAFKDFVAALRKHAEAEVGWSARTGINFWVCTFSNNQWRVQDELGSGDPLNSSFYLALCSDSCRGAAMVLDELAMPLTCSWCLFEVYQTCKITSQRGPDEFAGLMLCTPTGVLQRGGCGIDTSLATARRLAMLRLEDAEATSSEDKAMIDECVRRTPGGFHAMNRFVRNSIKSALISAQASFQSDFSNVFVALDRVPKDECDDDEVGL